VNQQLVQALPVRGRVRSRAGAAVRVQHDQCRRRDFANQSGDGAGLWLEHQAKPTDVERGGQGRHRGAGLLGHQSRDRCAVGVEAVPSRPAVVDLDEREGGRIIGVHDPVEANIGLCKSGPKRPAVNVARDASHEHGGEAETADRTSRVVRAAAEMPGGRALGLEHEIDQGLTGDHDEPIACGHMSTLRTAVAGPGTGLDLSSGTGSMLPPHWIPVK
jgi:hypothetical protein